MFKTSCSVEDTVEIGRQLGVKAQSGDIICLYGGLAMGKTHFTKGIALGLGVTEAVDSPTFAIINEYQGRIPLYHFDVYRIKDIKEMDDTGYDYYFYGEGVCVIEWAELIKPLIPDSAIHVHISRGAEINERLINIDSTPEGKK